MCAAGAKKRSVLLGQRGEPSAAPAPGPPDRHLWTGGQAPHGDTSGSEGKHQQGKGSSARLRKPHVTDNHSESPGHKHGDHSGDQRPSDCCSL